MLSRALAARHGTARLPATAGALPLARALRHDSDRDASSRAAGPPLQAASDSHSGPIRLTRTQVIMITRVAVHDWSGPVITESLERPGRRPSRLPLAVTLSGRHGSKFCRHVTVSARSGPGIIHWPPPPDLEPGLGLRSLSLEEVTFSNEQLEL